jgi:tRNA wybutosine-synthesizing protein 4
MTASGLQVYEQINPGSRFGEQMVKNLEARGAPLHGVYSTPSLEAHKQRLATCDFSSRQFAADLNDIYRNHLDPADRRRIEALEIFDEFEEWHLIMGHYCVAVGVKESAGVLGTLDFDTYEPEAAVALGLGTPRCVPMPSSGTLPNAD